MQFIYDNKENLIKPQREKNFQQKETHFGNERKKLNFEDTERTQTLTIQQNRILIDQLHSKTTEKYNDIEFKSSSVAKSQRSCGIKENLGSLIFSTPPKGRSIFRFDKDKGDCFFSRLIISPNTPIG